MHVLVSWRFIEAWWFRQVFCCFCFLLQSIPKAQWPSWQFKEALFLPKHCCKFSNNFLKPFFEFVIELLPFHSLLIFKFWYVRIICWRTMMKQINRFCLVLLLNLPKPDLLIILIWLVFLLLLLIFKIYIPVHFYFVSFNCLQFVLLQLFFPTCFEDH